MNAIFSDRYKIIFIYFNYAFIPNNLANIIEIFALTVAHPYKS